MDDLRLYEALHTDPGMMAELGGPLPRDGLAAKVRSLVEETGRGEIWYRVIVSDPGEESAGTVCVWRHDEDGEPINEIGWMVLPGFQGRGLATQAVRAVLDEARTTRRWDVIHAYPGVTNAPSNAICRKAGFEKKGEKQILYGDRTLHCNHWAIELRDFDRPS
jgi:RimJ/RimL family protein N-acetyltransferase